MPPETPESQSPAPSKPASARPALKAMPAWRKALLVVSVLLMAGGAGATAYQKLNAHQPEVKPAPAAAPAPVTQPERQASPPAGQSPAPGQAPGSGKPSSSVSGLTSSLTGSGTGSTGGLKLPALPKVTDILPQLPGQAPKTPSPAPSPAPSGGKATDTQADAPTGEKSPWATWSPAAFRLGFGFFVGFCIGCAMRGFFKMSMMALGVTFALLFGLQYAGFEVVNWQEFERAYQMGLEWFKAQVQSFEAFLTGQLPWAGSAGVGLLTGFKKF